MSWSAKGIRLGVLAGALAATLGTGACGFQPLYGTNAVGVPGGGDGLRSVEIAPIPNRPGQKLRNKLIDLMHGSGAVDSRYRLAVGYSAAEQKLAVSKDASTERVQLAFRAPYRLERKSDGAVLFKGEARTNIVYDFLDEQYGLVASRENAIDRAINEVAGDITLRVAAAIGRDMGDQNTGGQAAPKTQ